MKVNIVYDNSGPRTPSGATRGQPLASTSAVGIYVSSINPESQAAPASNLLARSVIQSNGELIGNAQLESNPLPPGVTA